MTHRADCRMLKLGCTDVASSSRPEVGTQDRGGGGLSDHPTSLPPTLHMHDYKRRPDTRYKRLNRASSSTGESGLPRQLFRPPYSRETPAVGAVLELHTHAMRGAHGDPLRASPPPPLLVSERAHLLRVDQVYPLDLRGYLGCRTSPEQALGVRAIICLRDALSAYPRSDLSPMSC